MTKLYIKTSDRGLQYFGKTIKDPHKYKGSGNHWVNHLKKHNPEVQTMVTGEYEDNDPMLIEHALGFSAANDIVLSQDWANIIPEHGLDGFDRDSVRKSNKDRVWTTSMRKKQSEANKGKVCVVDKEGNKLQVSIDDPRWISGELVGHNKGKKLPPPSDETRAKMSMSSIGIYDGKDNPNAKPISINGIEYGCIKDACNTPEVPLISQQAITKRLKDPLNTNYTYL